MIRSYSFDLQHCNFPTSERWLRRSVGTSDVSTSASPELAASSSFSGPAIFIRSRPPSTSSSVFRRLDNSSFSFSKHLFCLDRLSFLFHKSVLRLRAASIICHSSICCFLNHSTLFRLLESSDWSPLMISFVLAGRSLNVFLNSLMYSHTESNPILAATFERGEAAKALLNSFCSSVLKPPTTIDNIRRTMGAKSSKRRILSAASSSFSSSASMRRSNFPQSCS